MTQSKLQTERVLLGGLFIYHMAFALVFTLYLQHYGGDAIRYWALSADLSQSPEAWMDYWGHGTQFLQWLHYWPSKVLGMPFWFGNLLYAAISWLGIWVLVGLVQPYLREGGNPLFWISGWALLFLPNLHFWSAGVGKEAWLLLGTALAFRGFGLGKSKWIWSLCGLVLAFWVRPVYGTALGLVLLGAVLASPKLEKRTKAGIVGVSLLLGALAVWKLAVMMHLQELSIDAVLAFSRDQFEFLSGFQAGSQVPMQDFSWSEKMWVLFFRPTLLEGKDFWTWASGVENLVGLILFVAALVLGSFAFVSGGHKRVPGFLWAGLALGLGMALVYALTLNNLGIIMRMKSTYMIFVYFLFWMLAVLGIKSIIAKRVVE